MKINKVVVIGSGTMGSGIAAHLSNANIPVTLLDLKTEITEEAKRRIINSRPPLLVDKSKIEVHHYEKIINARVESTGTADPIPERTVEIDYETYRELVLDEDSRKIIYSYEYEVDKNEANRSIKLVDASFVSSVLDEARQTFR